jgi:hypothetical protein
VSIWRRVETSVALAYKDGACVCLFGRNGMDYSGRFPDLAAAVAKFAGRSCVQSMRPYSQRPSANTPPERGQTRASREGVRHVAHDEEEDGAGHSRRGGIHDLRPHG